MPLYFDDRPDNMAWCLNDLGQPGDAARILEREMPALDPSLATAGAA